MATVAGTQLAAVAKATPAAVTPSSPTPFAAASGDKIPLVGSATIVRYTNGDSSPVTITLDSVRQSDYGTDVNPVVTVAATDFGMFYIPASAYPRYADASNTVAVTYSGTTTLTGEVYNIP